MLSENIRTIRKSKGLSQEELAIRLHVVRQTVSKWEQGLSVPDAALLIALSETLETPVSVLLGETVAETAATSDAETLEAIAEKLEVINLQLARRKAARLRIYRWLCIALCVGVVLGFVFLAAAGSPYLKWNDGDTETAIFAAAYHLFEYVFVRAAPFLLLSGVVGIILTYKKG